MWRRLLTWLGLHVCGPYTKWETVEHTYQRPCRADDGVPWLQGQPFIAYTLRWQERTCETCGKLYKLELD